MKLKRSRQEVTHAKQTSVTVLPAPSDMNVPVCPHGPMLLFKREPTTKGGDAVASENDNHHGKQFFACSAYRNRKDCDFYYAVDDKKLKNEEAMSQKTQLAKDMAPKYDHNILHKNFRELCLVDPSQRRFCSNCNLFLKRSVEFHNMFDPLGGDHKQCEKEDKVLKGISDLMMKYEQMKLFMPFRNKSGEAQFYFTTETRNFIVEKCKQFSAVLAVGMPSVILNLVYTPRNEQEVEKLYLCMDIDWRLSQLLAPKNFAHFNMCNQHFFTEMAQKSFERFISQFSASETTKRKLLVLVDPPYGVKPEILRNLFKFIEEKLPKNSACKYILCMPYFLQPNIAKVLPHLTMTDYQCTYLGHRIYSGQQQRGSPARLFTNIEITNFCPFKRQKGVPYLEQRRLPSKVKFLSRSARRTLLRNKS